MLDRAFNEKQSKTVLGNKKRIRIVAETPLGYPAEKKESVKK